MRLRRPSVVHDPLDSVKTFRPTDAAQNCSGVVNVGLEHGAIEAEFVHGKVVCPRVGLLAGMLALMGRSKYG